MDDRAATLTVSPRNGKPFPLLIILIYLGETSISIHDQPHRIQKPDSHQGLIDVNPVELRMVFTIGVIYDWSGCQYLPLNNQPHHPLPMDPHLPACLS